MQLATRTTVAGASRSLSAAPSRAPSRFAAAPTRFLVVRRFKENGEAESLREQLDKALASATNASSTRKPTDTKLSPEQLQEVYNREPGNISPRMAEMRADLGTAATDLSQYQAFDGPIPETVNGRLAMLGVTMGLYFEATSGKGLLEQSADHPLRILFIGLLFAFASYAPVIKGYTRKEPFANLLGGLPWTPTVENWNGRLAMLGFTGMILTEAITGVNTLQAWGLQAVPFVSHVAQQGGLPPVL